MRQISSRKEARNTTEGCTKVTSQNIREIRVFRKTNRPTDPKRL